MNLFLALLKVCVVPAILMSALYYGADRLPTGSNINVLTSFAVGLPFIAFASILVAVRVRLLLRAFGIDVTTGHVWKINLESTFYTFLPLAPGEASFDLVRAGKLARTKGLSLKQLLSVSIADRAVASAGAAVIFFICVWIGSRRLIELRLPAFLSGEGYSFLLLAVAVAVFLLLLVGHRTLREKAVQPLTALFRLLRAHRLALAAALALSCVSMAISCLPVWVASQQFTYRLSFIDVLFGTTAGLVGQIVPVGVAGLGVGDLVAGSVYMLMGLSAPEAAILAGFAYLLRFAVGMAGAGLEFLDGAATLRRQFSRGGSNLR